MFVCWLVNCENNHKLQFKFFFSSPLLFFYTIRSKMEAHIFNFMSRVVFFFLHSGMLMVRCGIEIERKLVGCLLAWTKGKLLFEVIMSITVISIFICLNQAVMFWYKVSWNEPNKRVLKGWWIDRLCNQCYVYGYSVVQGLARFLLPLTYIRYCW